MNHMTPRKSVEGIRGFINLKCWKVWREAHKINEAKKFCISACGIKVSFCLSTSLCEETVNNLTGNDPLFMKIQKYFYVTLNSKDDMDIRDEVIYQVPHAHVQLPTKDEVQKIIRTSKNNQSPGEDNISAGHK